MTPITPLNVALVGYGMAGRTFHAPLIASTPGLALRWVVSQQGDAVRHAVPSARVTPTLSDVLSDGETTIVVIATPNALHAEQATAALQAGKHVVVDKPFATTVTEAAHVLEIADRVGRHAVAFQNRRFDSDFLSLQHVIRSGTLGELLLVESHFDRYRPLVRDRWREQPGPGSGVWYDLGAHLLDQAVQLCGAPLGITATLLRERADAQTDDGFHAMLRYPSHRVILRASSMTAAHARRFTVHGSLGSFEKDGLDVQEAALASGVRPGTDTWGVDPQPGVLTVADGAQLLTTTVPSIPGDYGRFYAQLRDAIVGGSPPPVTPDEIRLVMQLLEAGIASSGQRREIALHVVSRHRRRAAT
jgi:predicted dehydrogenase